MSLAVSYTTHTVEITASGLAVAAIGNSVEVSAYNHVVQVSPLVYQVSVAQAGAQGAPGPKGDTGPAITAASFIDNAIVFYRDDGSTVILPDAASVLKGEPAPFLQVEYSADGASFHGTYQPGDFYLRMSRDNGETWSSAIKFVGTDGTNGTDGKTWYRGTSDPSSETGVNGDFYLNYTTWHVFEKISGSWTDKGTIKGADGEDGEGIGLGIAIALS